MEHLSKELIAASTIPIVLSILSQGDDYGYSIIKKVQTISDGELNWKEGSLYPVLSKLEKKKYITSYVKVENRRNRKYYAINDQGKGFLESLKQEWSLINQTIGKLWDSPKNLTFS